MDNTPTLGFLLHDVARLLRKRFEQSARDLGLTRSQWQTLAYLNRNEGIHQGGLAEILEIEPITLVRILDKLEERGLDRAPPASDRPTHLAALSAGGGAAADRARCGRSAMRPAARRCDGLSEAERARLVRILVHHEDESGRGLPQPVDDREASHG